MQQRIDWRDIQRSTERTRHMSVTHTSRQTRADKHEHGKRDTTNTYERKHMHIYAESCVVCGDTVSERGQLGLTSKMSERGAKYQEVRFERSSSNTQA